MTALLSDDVHEVSVHRDNLTEEMLQLYSADATVAFRQLKVSFIGETGDDLGDLTKDLFNSLGIPLPTPVVMFLSYLLHISI